MKRKLLLAALLVAGALGMRAQKDVTSLYITNASLSSLDGWTYSNFNTPQRGNNTTGYATEAYSGWGAFSAATTPYYLKQTITLPAGNYTLVNYSFYREGEAYNTDASTSRATLYAGSDQVSIKTLGSITAAGYANSQAEGANAFDSKMYRNTVDFTIAADNTSIEIGLTGTFTVMRSWCIAGMFELINNDIPATMDAPFDVTGYITNPGFEYRDMTGWTVSPSGYFGTQSNNQSFKVGGLYAEKWQASGALPEGSMSQTLTGLPAGYYKLTANLGGNGTYVDLNGKTANWEADKDYTVGYVLSEDEDLTITAGKTAEGSANWIHFDNFRLQFCGDVTAALTTLLAAVEEYEDKLSTSDYTALQSAVDAYDKSYSDVDELLDAIDAVQALYDKADLYLECLDALDAAKAINQSSPMKATVLTALQNAIATTTVTISSTTDDITAAQSALTTATTNATTSIANYVEAKGILDAASTFDSTGKTSYSSNETIVTIQSTYDDRTLDAVTADQKSAAWAALTTACKAQVELSDGCYMTPYIANPSFESNSFTGWTNSGLATQGNTSFEKDGTYYAEAWQPNGTKSVSQTITSLPVGVYRLSATSKARGVTSAKIYAGDNEHAITIGDVTDTYNVEFTCTSVSDVTIGFEGVGTGATASWLTVDNFQLTYVRATTAADHKVDLLAVIEDASGIITAGVNVGTGAFQIPVSAQTALSTAKTTAQGVYDDDDATISDVETAIDNLNDAIEAYNSPTLNAPADGKLFNVVNITDGFTHNGKALTFRSASDADLSKNTTSMGWLQEPGSIYPQAVKFTAVDGTKNGYTMSYTRADGETIYVSTGSLSGLGSDNNQIRPTTDPEKALTFVVTSVGDNHWYLYNTLAGRNVGSNGDTGFYTAGGSNKDVRIQEAVENEVSLSIEAANQYGTMILPFDADVPEGVTAYSVSEVSGSTLTLVEEDAFEANTPYIVYAESGATGTLAGLGSAYTDASYTEGLLTGVYAATSAPNGSYVLQNNDDKVGFYLVDTSVATPTVGANRCYLTWPSLAKAFFFPGDDEATFIEGLDALTAGEYEAIYTMGGVKVNALQKGTNIVQLKSGKTLKINVK